MDSLGDLGGVGVPQGKTYQQVEPPSHPPKHPKKNTPKKTPKTPSKPSHLVRSDWPKMTSRRDSAGRGQVTGRLVNLWKRPDVVWKECIWGVGKRRLGTGKVGEWGGPSSKNWVRKRESRGAMGRRLHQAEAGAIADCEHQLLFQLLFGGVLCDWMG